MSVYGYIVVVYNDDVPVKSTIPRNWKLVLTFNLSKLQMWLKTDNKKCFKLPAADLYVTSTDVPFFF
jgi:hypothetical protein